MSYIKFNEAGYTTQYYIKAFFIRKDGKLEKMYLESLYKGHSLWDTQLQFGWDMNDNRHSGALWFKEKPSQEFLKKLWKSWWTGNPTHWMYKEYSGLDRLEIWSAPKWGRDRWKAPSKVEEFRDDWKPKIEKFKFKIEHYADDDYYFDGPAVSTEEFVGSVEDLAKHMPDEDGDPLYSIEFSIDKLRNGEEITSRTCSDYDSNWKIKVISKLSESKLRENDQFEEKYNVYCYYQDAYDGGEEDGDPRNDKPLNYKDTVALMKKLMADFKADKLYGSYLYSSTSKFDDAWRIMAMSDDVVYVKNLIMKDGKPRIILTYEADMALNWETEQEAKDFLNKHMAEINARELEDVSVVQGDGYDVEPCYLDIKAYPNCDTDTLIMKSYDWTTREGFKMKAGEIYP